MNISSATTIDTPRKRGWAFAWVGLLGFSVQLATLAFLTGATGWHPLAATAIAVELAVLHNFVWHERWTWRARTLGEGGALGRLLRFNATTGACSIAGNLAFTTLYAEGTGLPLLLANTLAVVSTAVVNFVLADRWVFPASGDAHSMITPWMQSRVGLAVVAFALAPAQAQAAQLTTETIAAWDSYIRDIEAHLPDVMGTSPSATGRRAQLMGMPCLEDGASIADPVENAFRQLVVRGDDTAIPGGTIHRWCGALFIPRADLDHVVEAVRSGDRELLWQEDVRDARVLGRTADGLRVYLRVVRDSIVTATYNTEHETTIRRLGPDVAVSHSVATRIAEVDRPSTRREAELPIGHDSGYLWRLNSYWRYRQIGCGVLVELESVSLSRGVPAILRPIAMPLVRRVARESVTRTLTHVRDRFANSGSPCRHAAVVEPSSAKATAGRPAFAQASARQASAPLRPRQAPG
jgi:putative flippase GtrA